MRLMTLRVTVASSFRECSQRRSTFHPWLFNFFVTSVSRLLVRSNFMVHQLRLVIGIGAWRGTGQPCQKQPSTNTANLIFGKTKSGFPYIGKFLRQPVILFFRKIEIRRSSVLAFPLPRIFAITSERFCFENTSLTGASGVLCHGDAQTEASRHAGQCGKYGFRFCGFSNGSNRQHADSGCDTPQSGEPAVILGWADCSSRTGGRRQRAVLGRPARRAGI